jgi:hypothetical protein
MQSKYLQLLMILSFTVLFACNKKTEKEDTPDIFAPEIKRSSPSLGSSFNSLYPVNIVGTVTDLRLDSLEIYVYAKATGKVLLHKFPDVKGKNGCTINESFGYSNTVGNVSCVSIIQAKDQAGNWSKDSVDFLIY